MRRIPVWHHYEGLAARGEYDPVSGESEPSADGEREAEFFRSALGGRKAILDVGCGPGSPLLGLVDCVESACGVDISPAMLAVAKRNIAVRGVENGSLVRGSAEALPFADRCFDGFAVSGTLESVEDAQAVLSEIGRVAEPGAVAASLEWDIRHQLPDGTPRIERWLRQESAGLFLQVRHLLTEPYRVRDERYLLDPESEFGQRIAAAHPLAERERVATELRPEDLPDEAVLDCLYDVETHFDPATLADAFDRAGFELAEQQVKDSFGVPHIFSVFRRRGG